MFIENVPKVFLYGKNAFVPGADVYSVGQGGVTLVEKPYYLGKVIAVEDDRVRFMCPEGWEDSRSLLDSHGTGEQTYNNWYLCAYEEDAMQIYDHMLKMWQANPAFEQARAEFSDWTRSWDYDLPYEEEYGEDSDV